MKNGVLAAGFLCGAVLFVLVLGLGTAHAQENTDPNAQTIQLLKALGITTLRILVWVSFSHRHRSGSGNRAANALSFA
jgi:hypothetical protein